MQHGVGASLVLVPTRTQCSRRGGPSSWHSNRRQVNHIDGGEVFEVLDPSDPIGAGSRQDR